MSDISIVLLLLETFREYGRDYVFNSIHNIQSDVPPRNILAMFKAIEDVRK
jgi:uroporphyrinogen-III decarboxylase